MTHIGSLADNLSLYLE